MSQYAESSRGARSRLQGARSGLVAPNHADPVGELSGFPLIQCPECGLVRVVEGRTKKFGENHGRLFFKCARNGVRFWLIVLFPHDQQLVFEYYVDFADFVCSFPNCVVSTASRRGTSRN